LLLSNFKLGKDLGVLGDVLFIKHLSSLLGLREKLSFIESDRMLFGKLLLSDLFSFLKLHLNLLKSRSGDLGLLESELDGVGVLWR